jgi:hypothetical protein
MNRQTTLLADPEISCAPILDSINAMGDFTWRQPQALSQLFHLFDPLSAKIGFENYQTWVMKATKDKSCQVWKTSFWFVGLRWVGKSLCKNEIFQT